jgi:hypothetical protein
MDWIVIVFGGLSAVAVIVLVAYFLIRELMYRNADSRDSGAANGVASDAVERRTDQTNDRR